MSGAAPALDGRGVGVAGPSPLLSADRHPSPVPPTPADPHPSSLQPASAVYEGTIRHRRFEPIEHSFQYRFFLMYLDLGELPGLLDRYPLYSARRAAPARFRREDFIGAPDRPLDECARDAVAAATGERPGGPVRLLTGLRYFGHSFNPVSFYYCFDPAGQRVEAIVADVQNIPWRERHPYVLARGERRGTVLGDELEKSFHVSPLMGMDQTYSFRASEPGESLAVHIESRPRETAKTRVVDGFLRSRQTPKTFDATLSLRRRELSRGTLAGLLARYPAMSLQVVAKIYAQALRLKLKGARYHPHPGASG
ncbi:MAG TPA: DUF1365 domain-containing protein [Solirubrobacterales bacterium]|nr:DUF1365 domain-containing protein [Solirubrobacterales bacterium]